MISIAFGTISDGRQLNEVAVGKILISFSSSLAKTPTKTTAGDLPSK